MKVTAKDVAHAADVSVSSVSRAFTPGGSIDPIKKQRILQVAATLGYRSPARRAAEALSTGTVTLVAGDLINPFYPMVLDALAKRLQAAGRQLLVYALPSQSDIDAVTQQVVAARPKAVIVTSARLTSGIANACREHGIRVILFNRTQRDMRIDAVTCDNYRGGRDVATLLLERGCQRIGFIRGIADTSTHRERARGFHDVLKEAGQSAHAEADGHFSYESAHAAAVGMLSARKPPDGLFCCNDIMALAAIDAAKARGLSMPDDLAVVGFDDIPMASWKSYQLTTVRQPVDRMVDETLALIDAGEIVEDAQGLTRSLPGKLVRRGSA